MSHRPALLLALGCLVAAPLAPAAAAPVSDDPAELAPRAVTVVEAPTASRSRALLRASEANVMPGERLTITAGRPRGKGFTALKARDRQRARLVLQKRVDGEWRKLRVRKFGTSKRVTFPFRALSRDTGVVRLRTIARVNGRTFGGARLRLPVERAGISVVPSGLATSSTVTFTSWFAPARAGRTVTLQVHDGGEWRAVGDVATTADNGRADVTVDVPAHPLWYRVVTDEGNGAPALSAEPVRTVLSRVPSVIAHRAGAGAAPEQTLAAVRQALDEGVPAMEIDVQLSKDGVPVVVHDRTLARTTDVEQVFPDRAPWNLEDFTLAEIRQLDAGSWFDARFAGEQIPTLDEVLTTIDGRSHLVVEVKSPGDPGNAQIAQVLGQELATGLLGQAASAGKLTFSSFDVAWLEAFAVAHPEVPAGVLSTLPPTLSQLDAWRPWAEEIHPQYAFVSRGTIDAARSRGLGSSVWTVNNVAGFRRALDLGADKIITDHPRLLAQVVDPPRP